MSDGRTAVGGPIDDDFVVSVYLTNGALDVAYGADGRARVTIEGGSSLAALADGALLAGGNVESGELSLARAITVAR